MKVDVFTPIYGGDYLASTGHLTTEMHGAYFLLLLHHWRQESLPDDDRQLAAIAKLSPHKWKKICAIIRDFFYAENGRLYQRRMVAEIEKAKKNKEDKSRIGREAAEARWGERDADAMPKPCPSPSPSLSESPSDSSSPQAVTARKPAGADEGFERFWTAYPRKVAKGHARKAWAAAIKRADPETILAAVARFPFGPDKQFIPHPATWLNSERWTDAAVTGEAEPEPLPANDPASLRKRVGFML